MLMISTSRRAGFQSLRIEALRQAQGRLWSLRRLLKGGWPNNLDGAWHGLRQRFESRAAARDRQWKRDTGRVQRAGCRKGAADITWAVPANGREPEEVLHKIRRQPERLA